MYPKSIKNLIDSFKYFPGIGEKTAERLAFSVLNMDDDQIEMISKSISTIKKELGSFKKMFIAIAYQTTIAWILATLIYQLNLLLF